MAKKRKFPVRVATVYCNGGCRAKKVPDGSGEGETLACIYGCLGCGVCETACKFDAIHLNEYGVAEVDEEKCIGCGACMRKCPRQIIHIRLQENWIVPLCSNLDKGFDAKTKTGAKTVCDVSCIGCGICARKCPADAISVVDFHAVIDEERCLSCGACAVSCPRGVIIDKRGLLTGMR